MTVYNGAKTVSESLESVHAQTYRDFDILVLDDGSTDDSGIIAMGLGARVIRVANAGTGAARNRLVAEAKGELIAFIDSDDTWLPNKLERQLSALDQSDAALIHTDGWYVYPGNEVVARDLSLLGAHSSFDHILPNNRIINSSVVFRREAMLRVGNFASEAVRCSDWYGWMMLASKYEFCHLPEKLVRYNVLSTSLANSGFRFHEAQYKLITDLFLPKRAELFSELTAACRDRYVRMLYRDAGIALSAMARHKKRDGDPSGARQLAIRALRTSPEVFRVWTRALSVCAPSYGSLSGPV